MIRQAKAIAKVAHSGQTDREGRPFIHHPEKIADMVVGEAAKTVAWLHDVLAETDYTAVELRQFFPEDVVRAIIALTRLRGEPYGDYLRRVSAEPLAVKVKLAELTQWADLSAVPHPTREQRDWAERCLRYRAMLVAWVEEQKCS
jgi:(p)ppGpp synthase/HD superfamily hydrolase